MNLTSHQGYFSIDTLLSSQVYDFVFFGIMNQYGKHVINSLCILQVEYDFKFD